MHTKSDLEVSSTYSLPSVRKRLVYLDQSFLSAVCFREDRRVESLLLKLQKLKAMKKIALVISDIHCRETSDFPGQHTDKMEKLWRFQNDLADGRIAANWADIFVAQHRRMLSDNDSNSYPVSDIRLRDSPQARNGIRVVMTNSWLLRIHRDHAPRSEKSDNTYREMIDRQAKDISSCSGVVDCHNYINGLWRRGIQSGIAAWRQRIDFRLSFEHLGKFPDTDQLISLKRPELRNEPFLPSIKNVVRGLDEEVVIRKWSELLEKDPIGPCPSVRIRIAFEAELLWTWYQEKRRNTKRFRECFGSSRQNDIDHVSAFVPYVDALTTDRDMHNLCECQIVNKETARFPCKVFSSKNYDKFEWWLDDLMGEGKIVS